MSSTFAPEGFFRTTLYLFKKVKTKLIFIEKNSEKKIIFPKMMNTILNNNSKLLNKNILIPKLNRIATKTRKLYKCIYENWELIVHVISDTET